MIAIPFSLNGWRDSARALAALVLAVWALSGGGLHSSGQSPPAAPDPAQVKAHAKEILSQPEFQPERADDAMAQFGRAFRERWEKSWQWLQDRWAAIRRWFSRLFPGLGGGPANSVASVVPIAFAALIVGFAGWLAAWLIRNLWLQRSRKRASARTAYDEAEADDGIELEPSAWMLQAQTYAGSDDYRRAFRAVFVATLLLLDEGGLIEFDRSRTNGDYLRLLRRKNVKAVYDILDPLVVEFDRRWYGRAETGLEDYRRVQQTFERVRTLMSETAPGATPLAATGKV